MSKTKLAEALLATGKSVEELSDLLNVPKPTIRAWIKGGLPMRQIQTLLVTFLEEHKVKE